MEGPEQAGPPRTPWEQQRRDRRFIIGATIAAIVLAVPTIGAAMSMVRAISDVDLQADGGDISPRDDDGDGGSLGRDVEVPTLDLDALSGTDAEFGRLLTDIDRSERTMLAAQEGMAEAFGRAGPDDDPDAVLAEVGEAAGAGQRQLQEVRSDVAAPVEDEVARELRDLYLSHLDAWVRYLVAIEEDPALVLSPDGEAVHHLAIDTTGHAFAEVLRDGLPDGLAPEVVEVAQAIADRGFPEGGPGDRDTV